MGHICICLPTDQRFKRVLLNVDFKQAKVFKPQATSYDGGDGPFLCRDHIPLSPLRDGSHTQAGEYVLAHLEDTDFAGKSERA